MLENVSIYSAAVVDAYLEDGNAYNIVFPVLTVNILLSLTILIRQNVKIAH
jgi:hypothetical protein